MPFYTEPRLKSKLLYLDKFDHLDQKLLNSSFTLPKSFLNAQIPPVLSQSDKSNFILTILFANLICGQKTVSQDNFSIKTYRLKITPLNTSMRKDKLFNLFEACLNSAFVTNNYIMTLVSSNCFSLWSAKVKFSNINDFMFSSILSNQLTPLISPSSSFTLNFCFENFDSPQNNFIPV
jgi:hypothetical protein